MESWYGIYVESRHEKFVASLLANKGFDVCLPLSRTLNQWKDRRAPVEAPIFPGYVFCLFDQAERTPILSTPGVVRILGCGRQAMPLDPEEVCALQALERAKAAVEPWPFVKAGEWVCITHGALEGLTGMVVKCKKGLRVVVSVALLQRSVAVEVDRLQIRPTKSPLDEKAPLAWQSATTALTLPG